MNVKSVARGKYVGYGLHYLATRPMRVAAVPVGYGHGYSRALSNQGKTLIRGKAAPVVGLVNMNMILADVTAIPDAAVGDEVVLIGKQGPGTITVSSFGEASAQLNYELLTRLPLDVPRTATDG